MLTLAETGFPAHASLVETFENISKTYPVLQPSKQTITDAVVAWRSMAKTLYELKKSGDAPVELKDIVANIVLPSGRSEAASSPSGSREKVNSPCKRKLTLDEVVDMFPSPAGKGDSVESSQGGSSEVVC